MPEAESRLLNIIKRLQDGVVLIDDSNTIVGANLALSRSIGVDGGVAVGNSFDQQIILQDFSGKPTTVSEITDEGKQMWVVRADRSIFSANVSVHETGQDGVRMVVLSDTSELKNVEASKNEFISLMSHQLRTPINIISWYGQLLSQKSSAETDPAITRYVHEIIQGSERLAELMGAIVNVSRTDLKKLKNKRQRVDVEQLIHDLLDASEAEIQSNQLATDIKSDPSIAPLGSSDKEYIHIALQSILSNAIRYSPVGGKISIRLIPVKTEEKLGSFRMPFAPTNGIIVEVEDTGIGIPDREKHKIFKKLFRAENAQSIGVSGLGLGLYISKMYINYLGGSIWFESKVGYGTTFSVYLPSE